MTLSEQALALHKELGGKIEILGRMPVRDVHDLSLAYTPGVAAPCQAIAADSELSFEYTNRGNLVAVVSDGSAVLGLGNIGPEAALPVMEGKCLLFKWFGGVDAIPSCIASQDPEAIVSFIKMLEPTIGGVNLEDIAAPRCFAIEKALKEQLSVPVFHDDQHGTAIVVLAAIINALKVVGKRPTDVRAVINGAGAGGIASAKLLLRWGIGDVILCDTKGIIHRQRPDLSDSKRQVAVVTNKQGLTGCLAEALCDANVFIGLSVGNVVGVDMAKRMAKDSIILAIANPVPEIMPELAREAGARVVGTGRSDFDNQINNVLAFPGVMRGALDVRATDITDEMKLAAAEAISALVSPAELTETYIIPRPFDDRVAPEVAEAVAQTAISVGVARKVCKPGEVGCHTRHLVKGVRTRW